MTQIGRGGAKVKGVRVQQGGRRAGRGHDTDISLQDYREPVSGRTQQETIEKPAQVRQQ